MYFQTGGLDPLFLLNQSSRNPSDSQKSYEVLGQKNRQLQCLLNL